MQNINKVLVFGATGAQGSPVVHGLLEKGYAVRTASRNADEARRIYGERVEAVAVDLLDTDSLRAAFENIDAAFLMVPVSIGGQNSPAAFGNALAAAKEADLKRLVFTTGGSSFDLMPPIAMVEALRGMTGAVLASGIESVVLRPTIYLENLLMPHVVAELKEQGTLSYPPLNAARCVSWTAQEDQAAFAVAALASDDAVGKAFDIATPSPVTGDELAELLSKKLGCQIRFTTATPAEFGAGLAPVYGAQAAQMISELYEATDSLPENGAVIDLETVKQVLPIKSTTVAEWINQKSWVSKISAKYAYAG